MVEETRNINNFEEVIETAEITCKTDDELGYYITEATKLITERQKALLELPASTELFYVKRKPTKEEEEYIEDQNLNPDGYPCEAILIYDQYDVLFSSEEKANAFMDSYMDIGMKAECEISKIENYAELIYRVTAGMLADDLVIKRIEFKDETESWHCEDLIYDPKREYNYISESSTDIIDSSDEE